MFWFIYSDLFCFYIDFNPNLSVSDLKTDNCTHGAHSEAGVATADTDYKKITNKRITFGMGEINKTINLDINNDNGNVDAEDEEFCVYLICEGNSVCRGREGIFNTSELRVTIKNDDSKLICIICIHRGCLGDVILANFASHHTRYRHVGFLFGRYWKENKGVTRIYQHAHFV